MRAIYLGKAAVLAAAVALASGCSSTSTTSDVSAVESDQQPADTSASSFGAGSGAGVSGSTMGGDTMGGKQGADLSSLQTVFYFDFDKAQIRSEAFDDLNAHAAYLSSNPTAQVVLEGHADERGTREYNMALGERRANAVSRYLALQGASPAQIEVVSFGEEKPAVLGHSESAWSQNRRVEVKYESY